MNQTTCKSSDPNQANDGNSNTSTDSLLSTNTTGSTINPLQRGNPPPKDYSAALSILQSRYGVGGQAVPSPKSKPSTKLQSTVQAGTQNHQDYSQLTLVSTSSVPSSTATTSTESHAASSSTAQSSDKKGKYGGLRSLFKGKGKDKKK